MEKNDEIQAALQEFSAASKALHTSSAGSSAGSAQARQKYEAAYGRAYAKLVKLGYYPRLRKKFRA